MKEGYLEAVSLRNRKNNGGHTMTLPKLSKLLCTPTEGNQFNNKYPEYADETERKGVWLRKMGMSNQLGIKV